MNDIDVVNLALAELGELSLTTFPDSTSRAADLCNTYFSSSLVETLEYYPWNEAVVRETIATSSYSASFEYDVAYEIPSNSIDIISINENDINMPSSYYEIQGDYILTNEAGGINLKYSKHINANEMTDRVARIFALVLAKNICIPLTANAQLKNNLLNRLEQIELPRAKYKQGSTQKLKKHYTNSRWITSRQSSNAKGYYRTY